MATNLDNKVMGANDIKPCEDCISRKEMLRYFEGWKNLIKYYHPYAKNFDIPYEEAIQRVKDVPPVKCVSNEVLEKIRAEIKRNEEIFSEDNELEEGIRCGLIIVKNIIDKYKEGI